MSGGARQRADTWFDRLHAGARDLRVAYFSAEFAVAEWLRIYSGGLGVLAGDQLKSASDLGVPLVGVGLFYSEGYFTQRLDTDGTQLAVYDAADPGSLPLTLEHRPDGEPLIVDFPLGNHRLHARVWRADIGRVPLYLLDTNVPANRAEDRGITDRLYGGDAEHRLKQEIVLGIGGMRALARLGRTPTVLHLNEGHAAFAAVERVRQAIGERHGVFRAAAERLRDGVVFTTHTPVPAGHDEFDPSLLERYLGGYVWEMREPWDRFLALGQRGPSVASERFNMTLLALRTAGRRNAVSRLHGKVSRQMWRSVWPDVPEEAVPIAHVTNGIHLPTWVGAPMAALYEATVGRDWATEFDDLSWHRAAHVSLDRLWSVRRAQREALVTGARDALAAQLAARGDESEWTATALDADALTIVFARRFATYKRATLLLKDPQRLKRLLLGAPVQFIFAGKAHPRDKAGQELLRRTYDFASDPEVRDRFVFLENYDLDIAALLVHGADVWLNVPRRPREASGTSGMKAAANGALNVSILDGWWAEAWTDHNRFPQPIGWAIPDSDGSDSEQDDADSDAVYRILESEVVPLFHDRDEHGIPVAWCERIRASIRQTVPFFNTDRMVREYVDGFYLPAHLRAAPGDRVKLDDVG